MRINVFAMNLTNWDHPPPLQRVWSIADAELSKVGMDCLKRVATDFPIIADKMSWQGLAIQEFAEVQDQTFPKAGRYFNINFFFFEASSVLREALVAGINGSVHASLAALRPAFEMFVLHRYWKEQRQNEDTYDEFYEWFLGTSKSPGFGNLLPKSYRPLLVDGVTEGEARALYAKLCTYVHKPALTDSITTIRGGNTPGMSSGLLEYWLQFVHDVQCHVLELLVRASPASLFPIDVTRKFGFNPPVGLFFDRESHRILEKAIGKAKTATFRKAYETADGPPAEIQWAAARSDLTDARIFKSWHDEVTPRLEGKTKSERMRRGRLLLKAKMRVIAQSTAYMENSPTMPDVREVLRQLANSKTT